jgi:hypothetical protein
VIRLDAATVLLQWASGGLLFLWVTSRRREVGIGYGWLLRGVFGALALGALGLGRFGGSDGGAAAVVRDAAAVACTVGVAVALAVSVVRRRAGVAGERALRERRAARLQPVLGAMEPEYRHERAQNGQTGAAGVAGREFPPVLDVLAPVAGFVGLVAAGVAAGGPDVLAVVRTLVGAVFLGAVTDAMLLGHWYLVQPGLGREPLYELVRWTAIVWPFEVAALLWPTGMASVWSGAIDDGYGGLLGWFWAACAVTTIALVGVTRAALRERQYSAVMAATGLLYLAILTAFGTDLVARAVLAS